MKWQNRLPEKPGIYWTWTCTSSGRGCFDLVELRKENLGVFEEPRYDIYVLGSNDPMLPTDPDWKTTWWWWGPLMPPLAPNETKNVAENNT